MVAMTLFHAEQCCHLVSAHAASSQHIRNGARQFLIYSTFELVVILEGC